MTKGKEDSARILLGENDSLFINRLKGAAILAVVLGHLGLGWIFLPFSSYINLVVPLFFFCSGYVFIYLYLKESNSRSYATKRLFGLLFPYLLVFYIAVIISAAVGNSKDVFDIISTLKILVIAPDVVDQPYPLGQIWFLRVLLFCVVSSIVIFRLYEWRHSHFFLLIPILVSTVFSLIQSLFNIRDHFAAFGHNFLQEIIYSAYFYIGAFVYHLNWRTRRINLVISVGIFLIIAVLSNLYLTPGVMLTDHAFAPDWFYLFSGVSFILFLLISHRLIELVIAKVALIRWLLDFCGKHSYGIFLNHTFFIMYVEKEWGWTGVREDILLACYKVILVTLASLLFALPITFVSNYVKKLTFR